LKNLFYILLFLTSFNLHVEAQDISRTITTEVGPTAELNKKHFIVKSFIQDDSTYKVMLSKDNILQQHIFDKDLNYKSSIDLESESRRSSYIWHFNINGMNGAISSSFKGLNQMTIALHDLDSDFEIILLNFERDRGEFPFLHFFHTDSSVVSWYKKKETRDQDAAKLLFSEFDLNGEQIAYWEIDLGQESNLIDILNCTLVDSDLMILVKQYRISPVDKRAGKVNYQYTLIKSKIRESKSDFISLSPTKWFANTPLVRFDGRYCLSISICGKRSVSKQKWLYSTLIDLDSGSVQKDIFPLADFKIPKNKFTYGRFSKSYKGFQTIGFINQKDKWKIVLESRNLQYLGMDGNRPILSYQYGPVVVLNWNKKSDSLQSVVLDKIQFSFDDEAKALSGKYVEENGDLLYFYNDNTSRFLGIPVVKRIEYNTRYKMTNLNRPVSKRAETTIELDIERRSLPLWKMSIVEDQSLIVPIQGKESLALVRVSWSKPE